MLAVRAGILSEAGPLLAGWCLIIEHIYSLRIQMS